MGSWVLVVTAMPMPPVRDTRVIWRFGAPRRWTAIQYSYVSMPWNGSELQVLASVWDQSVCIACRNSEIQKIHSGGGFPRSSGNSHVLIFCGNSCGPRSDAAGNQASEGPERRRGQPSIPLRTQPSRESAPGASSPPTPSRALRWSLRVCERILPSQAVCGRRDLLRRGMVPLPRSGRGQGMGTLSAALQPE